MPFFLKKQMAGVLVLLFSTPRSYANGHEMRKNSNNISGKRRVSGGV
ncbi:hypothetical protein E5A84_04720 [Helicobacter pylori]|uniref:Uncharacterized protein n=1 Tax=Helicobacter pylori TaxID=210 RepID=A0AAW9KMP2_HELPX|nr:hypothetical protein [Helicobacter pylori]MCQ2656490.1 hypothetical protein [Helicobacter pylori]MCQ2703346.1 hypothetical protein [Helicobacter pylori]MDZ7550470.1 hypothetical protein [Helicobacter pylori]WQR67150.1 hypothetical protein KVD31_04700 [Helicobacter pylori]WQR91493.1 hypothetical protein FFR87_04895 [Helicobacter pylori]